MKKILLLAFFTLVLAFSVSSQSCPSFPTPKSAQDLFNQLPAMDAALQQCPQPVQGPVNRIFKDETILVNIGNQQLTLQIQNTQLVGIKNGAVGKATFIITLSECDFDAIISNPNPLSALAFVYGEGRIKLEAVGFLRKAKLLFMKPLIKSQLKKYRTELTITCAGSTPSTASGKKPENCYETYMEGHKEYQFGKKDWDQWKAESTGVCQTQTSERPKGDCLHLFQQIEPTTGDTKWLCWY